MAIINKLDLSFRGTTYKTDKDLIFYKNDTGVRLDIAISNLSFTTVSYFDLGSYSTVDIIVSKPNKKTLCIEDVPVISYRICFTITKNITDVIGTYKFQIRLNQGEESRVTLPPCEYEVLEAIGLY